MKKVYAADFGAGNTCIYSIVPDAENPKPAPLNDPKGEFSGYAEMENGDVWLGMQLRGLFYHNLLQIERLHINLKALPTDENEEELIYYFGKWLNKLKEHRPQEFRDVTEAYWMIGCPTGKEWKKKKIRERYKRIFEQAGYENVIIVPESNAALAYYQIDKNVLDEHKKSDGLVLIDQGAYSLDATVYNDVDNSEIESFGSYLGASLIERIMVRLAIYGNEQKLRLQRRIINGPSQIARARTLYESEDGEKYRMLLLLKARELKETFFKRQREKTLEPEKDTKQEVVIGDDEDDVFTLFINEKMMRNILYNFPVRAVLDPNFPGFSNLSTDIRERLEGISDAKFDEFSDLSSKSPETWKDIGDLTWIGAFQNFLNEFDKKFDEGFTRILDTGGTLRIMLTGGGSFMPCIKEEVQNHYPGALIYDDLEAVSAIGRGMAAWAPKKIEAMKFEEAFVDFMNRASPDGKDSVISSMIAESIYKCIGTMIQKLEEAEEEALVNGMKAWLDYKCSSFNIPFVMKKDLNEWKGKTGIHDFLRDIEKEISDVKKKLNREFNESLINHSLERTELLKQDDAVFLSKTKDMLEIMFNLLIEVIAECYETEDIKKTIWSQFPNPSKGILGNIFSDERRDFFVSNGASLTEWVKDMINSHHDVLAELICEKPIITKEDEEYSWFHCFYIEGVMNLCNLMEQRVKNILGKLVLEEKLED